jgi:hypothetical protein
MASAVITRPGRTITCNVDSELTSFCRLLHTEIAPFTWPIKRLFFEWQFWMDMIDQWRANKRPRSRIRVHVDGLWSALHNVPVNARAPSPRTRRAVQYMTWTFLSRSGPKKIAFGPFWSRRSVGHLFCQPTLPNESDRLGVWRRGVTKKRLLKN